MIRYLRWVLRSTQRFPHRAVFLIDSKVALGAIAKGRSSSKPLNAFVRRAAALCFAGGLVLHCVFIPTKHNPSDWPSRGDANTWPTALRKRFYKVDRPKVCPGCGELPQNHPLHFPKRARGKPGSFENCCNSPGGGYAYDYDGCAWVNYSVWYARHLRQFEAFSSGTPARMLRDILATDFS